VGSLAAPDFIVGRHRTFNAFPREKFVSASGKGMLMALNFADSPLFQRRSAIVSEICVLMDWVMPNISIEKAIGPGVL